jgi:hypothetical protein
MRLPADPLLSPEDAPAEDSPNESVSTQAQIESLRPEPPHAISVVPSEQSSVTQSPVGHAAVLPTALPQVTPASPEAVPWPSRQPLAAAVLPIPEERRSIPPVADPLAEAMVPEPQWPPSPDAVLSPSPPSIALVPERLWLDGARPSPLTTLPAASRSAVPGRQMQAAAPDVQISIGVVEVHAVPRKSAPSLVTTARRPQLSLADYLAQRSGKTR